LIGESERELSLKKSDSFTGSIQSERNRKTRGERISKSKMDTLKEVEGNTGGSISD